MKFKMNSIASFLAALPIAMGAIAQEAEPLVLQEIIVTASKREATLQETALSVTVVTADTIKLAHIEDFIDLQSVVPSLQVTQQQSTANTNFVIRGFGNGANNPGIEPSVGVFVDGVYRSRSGAAINDLPRLERVEVLSGPQSTLFGKNASAGVVSIVTPTPSGDNGGYLSASVGDLNSVIVKGLYEGNVSENTTFDVSGSYNRRDGYFENQTLDEELNERNRFSVRGQLRYKPDENSSWRILADHSKLDEACCGVVNVASGQVTGAVNALGGQVVADDPEARTGFHDIPTENRVENSGVSIQYDREFDNVSFTSITAYRNSQTFDSQDLDFTSAPLFGESFNDINIDTFTQEFRLASNGGGVLDWLVGGFYFDESIEGDTLVEFGSAFRPLIEIGVNQAGFPLSFAQVENLLGIPVGSFYAAGTGTREELALNNQSISLFGQLDYSLTDTLVATLGLNYTEDKKDFSVTQDLTELRSSINLPAPFDVIPAILPNTIDIPNSIESNETNDDELTYTARLAWAATENLNIYGTYATGFKASSVNLVRDSAPNASDFLRLQAAGLAEPNSIIGNRFADPEEATIVELGVKTLFSNGAINLSIFDQKIENFQTLLFNGTALVLSNAGQQSVQGVEFDISYLPINSLLIGLKGTVLDPVFDEFSSNPGGDLTGQQIVGISKLNLSLSAQYDFSLYGNESFIRGDYQYEEDSGFFAGFPDGLASAEVSVLNLSAGIVTSGGYSFSIWGRNITDDSYVTNVFPSVGQQGSFSGFRNEPRTVGVTVRKDF